MEVRTRIAPSPTGELHIGTLRTILYDYALAKKHNGKFIVRIEDTDRNRLVEGSMERLLETIKDYGLLWDEGPVVGGPHAPYIQSERLSIYQKHAHKLVEKGHAYKCFCSSERLLKLREEQQAQGMAKTGYDKRCRDLSENEVSSKTSDGVPYVVRLKMPENEELVLHDLIHGEVRFNSSETDDMVILKSDGFPTYHLAAMVDDHLMEISHIMRGIEWMPSSPTHIQVMRSLGWEMPKIAHLPNLKEKGMNQKLSKRFGAVEAAGFLQEGYLPEAVLNMLMFCGWNPGTDKEMYTLEEFISDFSLEKVQKTDLVAFDRDKLTWFNGCYIRNTSVEELFDKLTAWSVRYNVDLGINGFGKEYVLRVLDLVRERMKALKEFPELTGYFFGKPEVSGEMLLKQTKDMAKSVEILSSFRSLYKSMDDGEWTAEKIDGVSHGLLEAKGYKTREAFMTLRVAVTGSEATPPIFDTLEVLGKEEVLSRLNKYIS